MPREEEIEGPGGLEEQGALQTEALRPYAHAELVACDGCLRGNAPTRLSCLYCGAALPATSQGAALRRPVLKKVEEWEQGFNVILLPRVVWPAAPEAAEEAAALLRLDAGRLKEVVDSGLALPLARVSTPEEAELIVERLGALGFGAEVLADEALAAAPLRARALGFDADALVCMNSPDSEPRRVPWAEVTLLVRGRIVSRRVEVAERRRGLAGRSEMVDAREIVSDEAVLDVYAAEGEAGLRVLSGGFDYSCLGPGKGLLASENFVTLVGELRARAPGAVYDEEYSRLRPLLADAWPPAERTESLGLRREGTGRVNTEAVTKVSNELQFTRYARLRHLQVSRTRTGSL